MRRSYTALTRVGSRRAGFTLVELLIVIAIIAVLIALLLPSLSKAREQANAVTCMSQMRNCGQAFIMYAQDFGGAFPGAINTLDAATPPTVVPTTYTPSNNQKGEDYWRTNVLPRYMNGPTLGLNPMSAGWNGSADQIAIVNWHVKGFMSCPSAMGLFNVNTDPTIPNYFYGTYAINAIFNGGWPGSVGSTSPLWYSALPVRKLSQVQVPPDTFAVMFDAATENNSVVNTQPAFNGDCYGDGNYACPNLPHYDHTGVKWTNSSRWEGYFPSGQGNVLFADWHVEVLGYNPNQPNAVNNVIPFLGQRHDNNKLSWPFWWGVPPQ